MKDDSPDWPELANYAADHARRALTVQYWIAKEAAAELPDARAVLDELDDAWHALDRLHDRVRHQARRLRQRQSTAANPLDENGRERLLREKTK